MPAGQGQQNSSENKISFAPEKPIVREKSDRRRAPRYSVMAAVSVVDVQSGVELNARITDLSISGCYVDTLNAFPAGTQIRVSITHEGKTFDALRRVAYSQSNMGMGVAFVKAEPDQLKTLREWISALKSQAA
jgi:hypothetical protein